MPAGGTAAKRVQATAGAPSARNRAGGHRSPPRSSGSSSAPATGVLGTSQDPQRIRVLDGLTTMMEEPMDEPDAPGERPETPAESAAHPHDNPYRLGAPLPPPAGGAGPPLPP